MSAFLQGQRRSDVYRSERHSHLDAFCPSDEFPEPWMEPSREHTESAVSFVKWLIVAVLLVVAIGVCVVLAPVGVKS